MLVKDVMGLGIPIIGSAREGLGVGHAGQGGTVPRNGKLHFVFYGFFGHGVPSGLPRRLAMTGGEPDKI